MTEAMGDLTRGSFASADELADQAHAHRLLSTLLGQRDVWQINTYKQLNTFTVIATLVPPKAEREAPVEEGSLALIATPQPEAPEKNRSLTAHGDTLYQALRNLAQDYDLIHPPQDTQP